MHTEGFFFLSHFILFHNPPETQTVFHRKTDSMVMTQGEELGVGSVDVNVFQRFKNWLCSEIATVAD